MLKAKTNNDGFGAAETVIILFIILVVMAAGWFVYEDRHKNMSQSISSSAAHLTITRANHLHQPGVGNFTKTVSDSSALTILHDINSLKQVPAGAVFNCPNDDGVSYEFTFTDPTLRASAPAKGCQQVIVNKQAYFSTSKFWSDISNATGQPIDPDTNFQ